MHVILSMLGRQAGTYSPPRERFCRGGRRGTRARVRAGKLLGCSPCAAVSHPTCRLGQIVDMISRKFCLLDTGSQVSLWPKTPPTEAAPHQQQGQIGGREWNTDQVFQFRHAKNKNK